MNNNFIRVINKLKSFKSFFKFNNGIPSFSQTGEDLIVDFIFQQLKIKNPVFLDLGAHHPKNINNTYLFYKSGARGINVEPDPTLIKKFEKIRPLDKNLNIGVGFDNYEKIADFYIMSAKALNTFSKEEALKIEGYGTYKIEQIMKVPLVPISSIVKYFENVKLNYVSMDVEGLDLAIIKTFDFNQTRPEVFCIETLSYSEDKSESKLNEIIDFMLEKDYFVYADTYINTIFVDKKTWLER